MRKPKALGYVRKDVSGVRQRWDEAQVRSLAHRFGYFLHKTVAFGSYVDDPVGELMCVIKRADAEAVFVPNLEHFDGCVPRSLVAVADVVTVVPRYTYARWATGALPTEIDGV